MNGKGQVVPILIVIILLAGVVMLGFATFGGKTTTETTVGQATQVAQATQSGKVASIKVFVRDMSANDINTKLAVATYCKDEDGNFIIDGTTSSTSTEISGQSARGKTVTCWAFDSTHQTATPATLTIDEDVEHVVIDAYTVPTNGKVEIFTDQLAKGTGGVVNVTSVGADSTGTMAKIRYTNNNTNTIFPLGGVYFDTVSSTNVSEIDMASSAVLSLRGSSFLPSQSSTSWTLSSLSTKVSSRKENWDFVFEIGGDKPVLLEENDFVESGTVRVTGDGDGCTSGGELISMYGFTKGYYKGTLTNDVLFGHETDASSSSVITADITGNTFYCVS